ncbi:MAG: hypothetical protein IJU78_06500 [Clostridia bacterium]|nr:hypothetical protein [Clostridia bacterium]
MAYKPYRGSSYNRRRKKNVIIICAVVLLIIAVAVYLFLREYAVYTADGLKFDFSALLPERESKDNDGSDIPLPEFDIPDGAGEDVPEPEPEPEPEPLPDPEPEPPYIPAATHAVSPDVSRIGEAEYVASLLQGGQYDTLALLASGADGVSPFGAAGDYITAAEDAEQARAQLAALREGGMRLTALVSVFRNETAARQHLTDMAVKTENRVLWLDRENIPWIDPYSEGCAEYIRTVVAAFAEMGFDEIVFTDFHFPVRGKTELISYGEQTLSRAEALEAAASAALGSRGEDRGIVISLLLDGSSEEGGQDIAALAPYFDRIYLPDSAEASVSGDGVDCELGVYAENTIPETEQSYIVYGSEE